MTPLLRIAVGVAVLAAAGCGGTVDVAGKVTYKGKPVMYGTVLLIGADGIPKSGAIQPDGTYQVDGVKPGPAKATVSSPAPPGSPAAIAADQRAGRGGRDPNDDRKVAEAQPVSPEVAKGWFPIPDKYADPLKSGLTADVKSGQPVDLDLK
jgi:hypothetical protein